MVLLTAFADHKRAATLGDLAASTTVFRRGSP
jgi:hypothetical protein